MAKFEIIEDSQGEFRWRLRADNNEIIADSGEGYTRKSACKDGIELVKSEAPSAKIVDLT